jgi:NAD(P)-dependent dehydrogenase (short-subunit alcohol dehydrogenase family)
MTTGQNLIAKVSVTVDVSISEVWQALVFGAEDKPDNYHAVTIELSEAGDETMVTLTQDENEEACLHSEQNWQMVLADFERPIVTAVRTMFLTTRAAARHMMKQKSGVIITVNTMGKIKEQS